MTTYFDKREGREKSLPDCGCAGLVWDPETQRCERPRELMDVLNGKSGLGFLSPGGGYTAAEDADPFWQEYDYWGIDPFWDFGGWDWAGSNFGFTTGGNQGTPGLWDDLFYFYLGQGYDPLDAAAMADADVDAGFAVSVETSEAGGLPRVSDYDWQDYITPWPYTPPDLNWDPWGDLFGGAPGGSAASPNLPGACPPGTYHPYPIGHPQQNECAPFPTDPAARARAQQQQQRQAQQARAAQQQQQQNCPRGQYRNLKTRRCEPIPTCPTGQVFSPAQGRCISRAAAQQAQSQGFPWLWLLLGAGALLALDGTREQRSGRGRK